jgi:amino acid transporter
VHGQRRTPWVAIVFVAALAFTLLLLGDLESLADTTVLLLLGVFVFVNVAVLVLRREPVEHEHWRAPTVLPVIGAAACLGLIVQKATEDAVVFAYAGGLLAVGVVLWLITRALTGPAEPIDPATLVD